MTDAEDDAMLAFLRGWLAANPGPTNDNHAVRCEDAMKRQFAPLSALQIRQGLARAIDRARDAAE